MTLPICVCSFTEKGDLLSQWRGYVKNLGGYSIGFDFNQLEKYATENGFELKACVYKPEQQKALIKKLIEENLEKYKNHVAPNEILGSEPLLLDSADDFCRSLAQIAPIIKDYGFKEEQEWRLISKGGISFCNLDFREGVVSKSDVIRIFA